MVFIWIYNWTYNYNTKGCFLQYLLDMHTYLDTLSCLSMINYWIIEDATTSRTIAYLCPLSGLDNCCLRLIILSMTNQ